ncbi:MAG TPA: hypothetical protein VK809_00150 [Bacteroidia bacterium]|jgi:hypothetical protein|nr:hypothetical protein [Bacteroidia bacterium]
MIEIFKTNVGNKRAAKVILEEIGLHHPDYKCNFDLEDCDKVLRIENASGNIDAGLIIEILHTRSYNCEILM